MPRRNSVPKRKVLPDPKFNSIVVTKLINQIMQDGKKGKAQKIVYTAFEKVEKTLSTDALTVFSQALENVMPVLETKSRRVGGSTYQVPLEVRPERRQTLGIRWLVKFTKARNERGMSEKLAAELIDAYNNTGATVKKREDVHKMAEANKAFAHFRF